MKSVGKGTTEGAYSIFDQSEKDNKRKLTLQKTSDFGFT